jgi:hypothetical protein
MGMRIGRSRPTFALLGVVAADAVAGGAVAAVNRAPSTPVTSTASRAGASGTSGTSGGALQAGFDLTSFGMHGGRWIGMLAADLGVTTAQLRTDLAGGKTIAEIGGVRAPKAEHDAVQAITMFLDGLAAKGVFTPAQAASLTSDAADAVAQLMDAKLGLISKNGMPGKAVLHQLLADMGQTPAQIEAALRGGATLSEIAGVHSATVEADADSAVQQLLDALVTQHVINSAQEVSLLADAKDAVSQLLNAKLGLLAH